MERGEMGGNAYRVEGGKMKKLVFGLLVSAFLLNGFVPGLAQENPQDMYLIEEVAVTATRTEQPVFDLTQSVTVLTREDILASPFERVEDIVRTTAGMHNFRHHGMQTNGIVSPLIMRGVGSNKVLVLVDGVPQNDNFNNAIAWVAWGHIPKDAIQRIEIVRGPTSALYGSEGLGGVVHIITRKPGEKRETFFKGKYGSADTALGGGYHAQKIRDFGYLISGSYENSDGFFMTDPVEDYNIERFWTVKKLFGKFTYDLDNSSSLSLSSLLYDQEMSKGREYFYDDMRLGQYWLNYSHDGEAIDWKGLVYFNDADKIAFQDNTKDNYASLFRKEKFPFTYTWGGDLQTQFGLFDVAALTLGMAYKGVSFKYNEDYTTMIRDAGAEGQQQFVSPFMEAEMKFLDDRLILSLGGRYDWVENSEGRNWDTKPEGGISPYDNDFDTKTWNNFSPKAGIVFHPDSVTALRASVGTGFRAPSLFELYKVHVRGGGTYYRQANPDLDPEKILSWDIGAERFLFNSLWARVTYYQSYAKDYIGDRLIRKYEKDGKTYREYKIDNINEVDIRGVEAELEWPVREDLSLFLNYTYNLSEIEEDEDNAELEGNYLPYDPRHKARAGVIYKNPQYVNVSLFGSYNAEIYYDNENSLKQSDYTTVDLSVSRKFFDRLTLGVEVENVFDKDYIIIKGTDEDTVAPGTIVSGSMKLEF